MDAPQPKPAESEAGQEAPPADAVASNASQLLEDAEAALGSIDSQNQPASSPSNASQAKPSSAAPFQLQDLVGTEGPPEKCSIDLLLLEDVLQLRRGSVVTLDKLAGDPVDLFVNGRLVARGEILVLNDNFCVRVAELVGSDAVVE